MSKQINLIDLLSNGLQNRKNISIYSVFGCNRLIGLFDGSDEMVHREPLRLSHNRLIIDGALR